MNEIADIICLNKRHTNLVLYFLADLQSIIDKAVSYDERMHQFDRVVEQILIVHNGIGVSSMEGNVSYEDWYLSLPNNLYWATIGFFASLDKNEESPFIEVYKDEALEVIERYIKKLKNSLIIQNVTDGENIANLN